MVATPALAATNYDVFSSVVDIEPDATLEVVETITGSFDEPRHGNAEGIWHPRAQLRLGFGVFPRAVDDVGVDGDGGDAPLDQLGRQLRVV